MENKNINGMMIAGVIINTLILFVYSQNPEYGSIIGIILTPFVILSIIGLIFAGSSNKKTGPTMVLIGCVIFVPIGLIGAMGARKVLDQIKRDELNLGKEDNEEAV